MTLNTAFKMNITNTSHDPSGDPLIALNEGFINSYSSYLDAQQNLHRAEIAGDQQQITLLTQTLKTKENFACSTNKLYRHFDNPAQLLGHVIQLIVSHPDALASAEHANHTDPLIHAYTSPVSMSQGDIPTPVESALATAKNLTIVNTFAEHTPSNGSMLLSGANAWGAFYAVRGGSPELLLNPKAPQKPYNEFSDIDLMVCGQTTGDLGEFIEEHITAGLIEEKERQRYEVFVDLYTAGEADIFSVRTHYDQVEESVHYLLDDTVARICGNIPIRTRSSTSHPDMHYIRDFRPNIPANVRKHGNYPLYDLMGVRKLLFTPVISEVVSNKTEHLGYLSENTVGGPANVYGIKTHYLGVLAFFLSIVPELTLDDESKLKDNIAQFQANIAATLGGETPAYIPRQERMPSYTIKKIHRSLS